MIEITIASLLLGGDARRRQGCRWRRWCWRRWRRLRHRFRTHRNVASTVELRDGAQLLLAHLLRASRRFTLLLMPPLTFGGWSRRWRARNRLRTTRRHSHLFLSCSTCQLLLLPSCLLLLWLLPLQLLWKLICELLTLISELRTAIHDLRQRVRIWKL
jgi:hypothetical protein